MKIFFFVASLISMMAQYTFSAPNLKSKTTYPLPSPVSYTTIFNHDFHQAIEKLAQKKWTIRNETDHNIILVIHNVYVDSNYGTTALIEAPTQEISVGSHDTFSTKYNPQYIIDFENAGGGSKKIIIKDIQFKTENAPYFLNLENKGNGYTIVFQKEMVPSFPQIIPVIDFTPHYLDETNVTAIHIPSSQIPSRELCLDPNNLNEGFVRYYNSHLYYLYNTLFPQENINKKEFFDKFNNAYKKNSLEHLTSLNKNSKMIKSVKVPPIIHTLWFTSDEEPKELPERYIYWLKKSIEACPPEHGFSHWLWVHDKTKLPNTIKALEALHVEVHETKELGNFPLKNLYDLQLKDKRFGRVSDIFRLVVLDRFGGIYRDTDYRIHQSLLPLLNSYDFVAAREPWWNLISNALIIACPGHPMIRKAMDMIQRNCQSSANPIPSYLQHEIDNKAKNKMESKWYTIFMTGPGMFFPVIDQAFNQEGYTDIILPHPYLLPSTLIAFPQGDHIGWNQSVPLPSYGVHYFEGSWTPERTNEFGSRG